MSLFKVAPTDVTTGKASISVGIYTHRVHGDVTVGGGTHKMMTLLLEVEPIG